MNIRRGLFVLLLVTLLVFVVHKAVLAQQSLGITPSNTELLLTVTMVPEIPGPNTPVNISVESYSSININSSLIEWLVNGKAIKRGVGEKRFTFETGGMGTVSEILIKVTPPDSFPFTRKVTIRPTDMDLIWEARTYTPPFYAGRSLYSAESLIMFEAIPHFANTNGVEIPKENIIYTWKADGKPYQALSGYGKSFFWYNGSLLDKTQNIEVVAESVDGGFRATKSVTIDETSPLILIYESNPLYGPLYNKEVGSEYKLATKEVSFIASPYFFSISNFGSGLDFSWLMNGNPTTNSASKNEITLRQDAEGAGSSRVSVSVNNAKKLLQSGERSFLVTFGKNQ